MGKKYALYSMYLNIISLIIGGLCIFFSIRINKFLVVSIILEIMTLFELGVNIYDYRKIVKQTIDKRTKI
jgi:hypothetical protein